MIFRLATATSIFSLRLRKMSSLAADLFSFVNVRGMKVLDREKFVATVSVPVLKVDKVKVNKIRKFCKPYFLKLEKFKPVQSLIDDNTKKYIYLTPEKVKSWTDFPEDTRQDLNEFDVDEKSFCNLKVTFGYDNLKYDHIFKAVLPENEEVVSSYSQIGHIVHLNLRDHLLDYKQLIGQVLLDKIKTCKTVVNKSNIIDNTYRNFSMEVISGEEDFLVTVKENNCNFHFDFSKVYWNPRLGKEHERILSFLKPYDILFDVFCGVGPFSVPAAKRKTKVYANDLNPESYHWLNHNAKQNKINTLFFKSYNLDGKDFILTVFKDYLLDICNGTEKLNKGSKIHITMNLPALAVDFLQYFNGLIDKDLYESINVDIVVYVYTFVTGEDLESIKQDAIKIVCNKMNHDVTTDITDVFDVRNVSPKKEMMRVTFRLTKQVLCKMSESDSEPLAKKSCLSNESGN